MATFPTRRFHDADASLDEVKQLQEEFDRSDPVVQQGIDDRFRTLSVSGIREYLTNLREIGHFDAVSDEGSQTALEGDFGRAGSEGQNRPDEADEGAHARNGDEDDDSTVG